jgi:hypothetical protein
MNLIKKNLIPCMLSLILVVQYDNTRKLTINMHEVYFYYVNR